MYTPGVTRHRKNLRQAICQSFPGKEPEDLFMTICKQNSIQFINMAALEPFCQKASVPAAVLHNIFAPYGTKDVLVTREQWVKFINDDFPDYENTFKAPTQLTDKQSFILTKFLGVLKTKFGATLSARWNSALARNPPNTLNTTLRISALVHLFNVMNLPFSNADFVDAIFAFYGEKVEGISFAQFGQLFDAFP